MATSQPQRSVPEVLQNIVSNLQEIIRSEFRLAKTEIKEEASLSRQARRHVRDGPPVQLLRLRFFAPGICLRIINSNGELARGADRRRGPRHCRRRTYKFQQQETKARESYSR